MAAFAAPFGLSRPATIDAPQLARRLARLRRVAWVLDAALRIPGTRMRVGLNGLIGLTPAAGDLAMGLISLLFVIEAWRLGVPTPLLGRMLVNVAIETAAGAVPVLGDLFDVAFKANLRNLALIERHFDVAPR